MQRKMDAFQRKRQPYTTLMEAVRKMQAAAEDHIADLGWQRLFSLFDTDGNGNLDKDGARLSSCSELVALCVQLLYLISGTFSFSLQSFGRRSGQSVASLRS